MPRNHTQEYRTARCITSNDPWYSLTFQRWNMSEVDHFHNRIWVLIKFWLALTLSCPGTIPKNTRQPAASCPMIHGYLKTKSCDVMMSLRSIRHHWHGSRSCTRIFICDFDCNFGLWWAEILYGWILIKFFITGIAVTLFAESVSTIVRKRRATGKLNLPLAIPSILIFMFSTVVSYMLLNAKPFPRFCRFRIS